MNTKYKKLKRLKNEMERGYETLQYLTKEFFDDYGHFEELNKERVKENYGEIRNLLIVSGDYVGKVYEEIKDACEQAEREWMKGVREDEEEA